MPVKARLRGALRVVLAPLVLAACSKPVPPECAGPALEGAADYEAAQAAGYEINRFHKCIDKASFDAVNAQGERYKAAQRAKRPALLPEETKPEQ